jgi:two-component system nitrate/nitrite response regulator NarL
MRRSKLTNIEPVTVLVSDSTAMGCQLLSDALKNSPYHFSVVAHALNIKEILQKVEEKEPQVTLVSANLEEGPLSGFPALQELHASHLKTKPVMLLEVSAPEMVVNAFRAGAKGIFCRKRPFEDLCKCIHSVNKGQIWATSDELQCVLEVLTRAAPYQAISPHSKNILTKREREVVSLVSQGMTNQDISRRLNLSTHTVKNYLFRIFEKLGISNRVELVLYSLDHRDWTKDS